MPSQGSLGRSFGAVKTLCFAFYPQGLTGCRLPVSGRSPVHLPCFPLTLYHVLPIFSPESGQGTVQSGELPVECAKKKDARR